MDRCRGPHSALEIKVAAVQRQVVCQHQSREAQSATARAYDNGLCIQLFASWFWFLLTTTTLDEIPSLNILRLILAGRGHYFPDLLVILCCHGLQICALSISILSRRLDNLRRAPSLSLLFSALQYSPTHDYGHNFVADARGWNMFREETGPRFTVRDSFSSGTWDQLMFLSYIASGKADFFSWKGIWFKETTQSDRPHPQVYE